MLTARWLHTPRAGDYCDAGSSYVCRTRNFSNNVDKIRDFVEACYETGGGDDDECYELALLKARTSLKWKPEARVKALVMIGDSNPHEPGYPLATERIDWRDEARELRRAGVVVHAVQVHGCRFSVLHMNIM